MRLACGIRPIDGADAQSVANGLIEQRNRTIAVTLDVAELKQAHEV